ncbi:hypothetical protein AgCh_018989 [Apium graveolens]
MADFQGWGIIVFILIISTIIRTILKNRTRSSLPPGPFRLPIIGHLHLLAPIPHQALHKLSKRYGPLMHIFLGSNPCVIISSPEMAKEFLKTHEASFSDRPQTVASMHLSYDSQDFMFAPYGPYWKFVKKLFMSDLLGGQTLDLLQSVRRYEIQSMINVMFKKSLAGEAVNVGGELIRLTNNVISSMVMRKRSESEEEAGEVRKLIKEVFDTSGIFNLSDFIWFCKNLDLQGVKKSVVDVRGRYDKMMDRIIEEHRHLRMKKKEGSNEADAPPKDFLDTLLDIYEDDSLEIKLSMDKVKAIILDMLTAGTDTSASVIEWTLAELINHPIVMEKVRREIDTVVGKSRLVEESDIVNLPYLQAIVKETLRLHPSGSLIPRQATEGCNIGNYYIPAETRIFVNVWALGRDPNYWENALEFKPERFIMTSNEYESSGKGQVDVRGQHFQLLPFGSGRRGCPGTTLALKIIQTTVAAMIQCFEWNVVGNETYKSITPVNMEEGKAITLSRAHPLICVPEARLNPFPII